MSAVRHTFIHSGFKLSTDYKLLWDLIFKGHRIPAWLVYTDEYESPIWDLVEVKKSYFGGENDYSIGTRGMGYDGARTFISFETTCQIYSLHFIIPEQAKQNTKQEP
jgi:hypothetical protein